MPNIDLSILNQRQTPAFYADVFANRPAAGFVGRIFVSTDTYAFYRDNGTSWDLIGGPGTGTVTGTGANGQVTFWNGASTITGSNDLFWDATNGHLGVNTNAPGTALDVHHDQNTVAILNQTTATNDVRIGFQNNGVGLWRIGAFYNAGANDFGIFDAVGNIQPVTVKKTTGQVLIGTSTVGSGKLVVASASSDNGIQIVGASAPSLRIDSAESGPTKRAGLGISTATNNFIQGSADRDFCIFNGSTAAASPILFGVYDAGTVNVQEAARISAARNFLVGGSVDGGQKLQVTGSTLITGNSVDIFTATGIGSSAASGLMRVISGGTSVALAVGQSNSTRYTGIGANFINVYNDDFFLTTTGAFPLSIGTNNTARLTIASTGAATFSSNVSVNGLATSANYKLGASGRAYFSGLNDKGIFISDSNSPAYVSLVGLNSAISSYNNVELRASGTDGQLYLTTAGNVLVNKLTDSGQKFQVSGTSDFTGVISGTGINLLNLGSSSAVLGIGDTTTGGTGLFINSQTFTQRFVKFSFQGNPMGEIFYNGVNTTYAVSGSDIRLKKNIEEWTENVLDLFKDINPKLYNWNFQKDTDTKCKGFIAQEMADKFPEVFHKGQDDLYLYNPSGMVVYLIKAIQELQNKIENLK